MKTPEGIPEDIFLPGGRVRPELLEESAAKAIDESIRLARETRWESVRSPHIFMGLLATPDPTIRNWGKRLEANLTELLAQFQELFHQESGNPDPTLDMNREFLSDNAIRLLREAYSRATSYQRSRVTSMDLLITVLTTPNSIIAQCFENNGITAAKLTELAVMAEQNGASSG